MLLISELFEEIFRPDNKNIFLNSGNIRFEKNTPPVVVWNINNSCNMTCPHCYASAKIKPDKNEISLEEAYIILNKLKEGNIKVIILSGGEPLLRKDIFSIIEYAKKLGFMVHLSSNGSLINQDIAKHLKDTGIGYVGVSIDGLSEYNDTYRNLENGFTLALNGLKYCKENQLKTGIRMTLTSKNLKYWKSMLDIAQDENIDRFYISHLLYSGRGEQVSKDDLSKNQIIEFMEELLNTAYFLFENRSKLKIVTGGNDVDGVYMLQWVDRVFGKEKANLLYELLLKRGGNSAGEKIINIDHRGEVHPDQFWRSAYCGNLLDKSLKEILSNELIAQLKSREKYLQGKCKNCKYLAICRGSHRERAISVYKDLWAEDPSCYIEL